MTQIHVKQQSWRNVLKQWYINFSVDKIFYMYMYFLLNKFVCLWFCTLYDNNLAYTLTVNVYTTTANQNALLCFDRLSGGVWEFSSLVTGHWPGGPAPFSTTVRGQWGQPGGQSGVCGGGGAKVRPRDRQKVGKRIWNWLNSL